MKRCRVTAPSEEEADATEGLVDFVQGHGEGDEADEADDANDEEGAVVLAAPVGPSGWAELALYHI